MRGSVLTRRFPRRRGNAHLHQPDPLLELLRHQDRLVSHAEHPGLAVEPEHPPEIPRAVQDVDPPHAVEHRLALLEPDRPPCPRRSPPAGSGPWLLRALPSTAFLSSSQTAPPAPAAAPPAPEPPPPAGTAN